MASFRPGVNNKQKIQDLQPDGPPAGIVAAARSRFQQFGYAKTSMQEIAAACGMSAANLYRFYDGKIAIGSAVAAGEQAELFAACDAAVAAAPLDVTARLIALFHALIDSHQRRLKQHPLLFELGLIVAREIPGTRRAFLDEVERRIVSILAAAGTGETDDSRLILLASAPFVLPWMMLNKPFGNPRPRVVPLVTCLVSGLAGGRHPAEVGSAPAEHPHPFSVQASSLPASLPT